MKNYLWVFLLLLGTSSCGLFGIHFKVKNPLFKGKYPHFSKEVCELGSLNALRKGFDVTFYDIDLEINYLNKSIGGVVGIQAKAVNSIDSILLDLDQELKITAIKWDNKTGINLEFSRKYRSIYLKLPQQVQQGKTFMVYVFYSGSPQIAKRPPWDGGVVWKQDETKHPWAGVACETEGASVWLACKDQTNDEPDSVNIQFTIPDTCYTVVSNGQFIGKKIENNKSSFNWKISYPINVYNITYYVGNFVLINDEYTGNNGKKLPICYYALKENETKAKSHFPQVKKHIKTYEEIYGEYAWYRDGFKLVESPYAGMEHQSAIAYGNGYKNDLANAEDYIILHETGHEWFGNAITARDLAHVWLQEGITTYGEYLYLEKHFSANVINSHMFGYRLMIKNKRPLVGPEQKRYFDYHDADVYFKGAWMLHTLRNQINNDSLFFQILKTFYSKYGLTVCDSKDFIEVTNEITGSDYHWFFDQYLYENKVPILHYKLGENGNFSYKWTAVNPTFDRIDLEVKIGNQTYIIRPTTILQTLKIGDQSLKSSPVLFDKTKYLVGYKNKKHIKN